MKVIISVVAGAAFAASGMQAQSEPKEPVRIEHDVVKIAPPKGDVMFERHAIGIGPQTVQFVSAEAGIAGKVVKNAPYSAEAVTETTQTLHDGNRISNKSTAATYRDSQGRTRRDMTMPAIGPWAADDAPTMVWINDPVAGVNYHLDTKQKTARKLPGNPGMIGLSPMAEGAWTETVKVRGKGEGGKATPVAGTVLSVEAGSPGIRVFGKDATPPKTESLGKQIFDGVEAEGTRSTMTIPAGQIGNERDINIVNERWYSSELQTVIMSKHSDPRMGDTTYKLTSIKLGDPHPSLFEVPTDYTVTSEAPHIRMMRKIEKDE